MEVGDLVKGVLTEQIGIVLAIGGSRAMKAGLPRTIVSVKVMWTTQGDSLFGPGSTEWSDEQFLEHLTNA